RPRNRPRIRSFRPLPPRPGRSAEPGRRPRARAPGRPRRAALGRRWRRAPGLPGRRARLRARCLTPRPPRAPLPRVRRPARRGRRLGTGTWEPGAAWLAPGDPAGDPAANPTRRRLRRLLPRPADPAGLSHFWVYGIAQAGPREIWIATFGGGVDVVDPEPLAV